MTVIRVGNSYTPPENEYDGDGGVFPVTLVEISPRRTIVPQTGPNAGKDVDLQDWTFAIDDGGDHEGQVIVEGCTAPRIGKDGVETIHPKSKYYGWMTALFGGRAAPEGTDIDVEKVMIGRRALATIQRENGGYLKLVNLGALPTQTANIGNGTGRKPKAPEPEPVPAPPLREQVAAGVSDLPF
jgi:hypothetical protein